MESVMVSAREVAGLFARDGRHLPGRDRCSCLGADHHWDTSYAVRTRLYGARTARSGAATSRNRGSATRGGDQPKPFEAECDRSNGAYGAE